MPRTTALLASLGLILALFPALTLAAPRAQLDTSGDRIAGSWIVTLRDGVDSSAHSPALARQAGGRVGFVYEHALNGFSFKGSDDAAAALLRSPLVARVEADGAVSLVDTTQNNATWGLDRLDERDLPLDGTYTYAYDGTGVTAYVIDTGIRITHSEFASGRATHGYDSVDNDFDANDCHGHGTHVAGTVGGTTFGVAKNVSLVAVRVLDCNGSGTWSGVIAGIDWVTVNANKPAVANMSLGGSANSSVDDAVENSIASGVSYAVAAGNGNIVGIAQDACKYSPARAPNAMTIGATDKTDTKASWSNYGPCVDWFAPGVSIESAWNTSDTATRTASGTSMASPHTAGAAALYLHANAKATPAQVRDGLYAATTQGIVKSSKTANNHLLYSRFDLDGSGGGGGNSSPTADDVSTTVNGGESVAITLTGHDAETCDLVFTVVKEPDNGTRSGLTDNSCTGTGPYSDTATVTYTATAGSTEDTFTYKVTDGNSVDSNVATVTITVVTTSDGGLVLTVTPYKVMGLQKADLAWSPSGASSHVNVYRDTLLIATTTNVGAYTDHIDLRGGGSYTYKVCEATAADGTENGTCSNDATASY